MKSVLVALFVVIALAACRDEEPGEAPPIGALPAAATTEAPAPATDAGIAPVVLAGAPADAATRLRDFTARARARLDAAWNDCGTGTDAAATRCRDEAMLAYDAALAMAHETFGEPPVAAEPAPVVTGARDFAALQVTGTRG